MSREIWVQDMQALTCLAHDSKSIVKMLELHSVQESIEAELKETEVRFRDESDGDNDDDDDDESTLGKKEEELLGAKEKTMEEVSEEKESLETKGSMTEVKIRQDVEASSTMEIPQAESSTRMKSLLYAESEECKVDHQGTTWNLTDIQAGGCITFTQDAVSMPLLFGCKLLEPTVEFPPLNKDERLVSSVIELTCDEQPDIHFTGQSKGEVVVALSHSAPKLEGYEVLIGELISSDSSYEWKDLETTNIWQIPDIKDDFAKLRVPYAEAKVTTCGVFAVIYRLKSYIYSTRVSGNEEITHKIPEYPEVSVTISAENVRDRSNLELILKVQEIPQQWFDCGEEFAGPVLHIKCPQITDLAEPATITLPLLLQGDKDELSKFSATDLRVFKCRSGDERADWDEITMQLPNAVELMNGVVRFQVKHFCRFTVWPSKKRRLRDRRLAHRINRFTRPFPLEAGFFACLCNTVDMSPGHAQLRLYCYPARLEPKVIENACSAHDIDRYGNGDSLLTLFHGDELRAKLWRGSEVKKTLKLRFRYDRKFEVDAIVRVLNEGTPHVKFLQHLREQSPRKLCELTIATQCQVRLFLRDYICYEGFHDSLRNCFVCADRTMQNLSFHSQR
ncbi:hypothetical protein AWC38_SpisGene21295 [Stylophora pistillata]|uniref:Uncharacterized protein n=1 Tax=Stylophora pistillata TaxID=50429 RepID=A0A2B4RDT8_STYPI|nr:hypothetical protein AWC38_SpisGene21295 [Stylophora pistillata]